MRAWVSSDAVIIDTLATRRADMRSKGTGEPIATPGIDKLEAMIADAHDAPRAVADLVIDGADLCELGYQQGPAIGETASEGCSPRPSTSRSSTTATSCSSTPQSTSRSWSASAA